MTREGGPLPSSLPGTAPSLRVRRAAMPDGYGRFVARMKLLLPGLATIMLGLLVAWPWISDQTGGVALGFSAFDPRTVDFSSILKPRYMGTDRDNNPYIVTADTATDLRGGDGRMRLVNPKGDLQQDRGQWASVESDIGYLSSDKRRIDLESNVVFYRDDGLLFRTNSAAIELDHDRASGQEPVEGQGPDYTITAQGGFRLEDGGARIFFLGPSRLRGTGGGRSRTSADTAAGASSGAAAGGGALGAFAEPASPGAVPGTGVAPLVAPPAKTAPSGKGTRSGKPAGSGKPAPAPSPAALAAPPPPAVDLPRLSVPSPAQENAR